MVPYIFAFFAVGIFVVDTNNYKLTKVITFKLICLYAKVMVWSFIFRLFKWNSLYLKIWHPVENKMDKVKKGKKENKKKMRRKRKIQYV